MVAPFFLSRKQVVQGFEISRLRPGCQFEGDRGGGPRQPRVQQRQQGPHRTGGGHRAPDRRPKGPPWGRQTVSWLAIDRRVIKYIHGIIFKEIVQIESVQTLLCSHVCLYMYLYSTYIPCFCYALGFPH